MFEARQIGKTDVKVSAVSLGCSGIANLYVEVSEQNATALLDYAWQRGIRYFDAAPHYGRGRAEERLGAYLSAKPRESYVVSTKVGRVLRPSPKLTEADGFLQPLPNAVHYDYSAAGIRESFEGSCERLRTERIDIIFVHDIGTLTHGADNSALLEALLGSGLPELQRLSEVAEILELTPLLDRKPGALSGGQRQRIAMGRAIVRDPEAFLFDEPLSNLDAKLRGQMRAEIKRLHQRLNNTIIYVTHDQVEAMTLADKIVIMKDGRIEQQGTPDEVFHDPDTLFVAGFMGSPPMNLIDCKVTPTGIKMFSTEIACSVPKGLSPGDNVVFGIRSDDIRPTSEGAEGVSVDAQLDLIEQLGTENLVHFRLGADAMIGKTGGRTALRSGETVPFTLQMNHAYFFDPETGKRIR